MNEQGVCGLYTPENPFREEWNIDGTRSILFRKEMLMHVSKHISDHDTEQIKIALNAAFRYGFSEGSTAGMNDTMGMKISNMCDVCGGTAKTLNDEPCICGDGTLLGLVKALRILVSSNAESDDPPFDPEKALRPVVEGFEKIKEEDYSGAGSLTDKTPCQS